MIFLRKKRVCLLTLWQWWYVHKWSEWFHMCMYQRMGWAYLPVYNTYMWVNSYFILQKYSLNSLSNWHNNATTESANSGKLKKYIYNLNIFFKCMNTCVGWLHLNTILSQVFVTTTNTSLATAGAAAATLLPASTLFPFVRPSKCSQVQGTTHCTCEAGYTISGRDTSICTGK